jgi:hypothetical protein
LLPVDNVADSWLNRRASHLFISYLDTSYGMAVKTLLK